MNSIDIIQPFTEALDRRENTALTVQIIGGVGVAALLREDTVINTYNKEVIASPLLVLPTLRSDGTLRDLDVLVHSNRTDDIDFIEDIAKDTVGKELDLSVFGFKSEKSLQKQISHPLGLAAFKAFLSDRYVTSDGMVKSLYPFSAPINPESLETWNLMIGDMHVPIPNPAMSIINYTNRSISGLRRKDKSKVEQLADNVFTKAPELRDWAIEGPGASQVELGLLFRSLTQKKNHSDVFNINRPILTKDELVEHEYFMLPEYDHQQKLRILAVAAFKAGGLNFFESNSLIVTLWQKYAERHAAKSIVKND